VVSPLAVNTALLLVPAGGVFFCLPLDVDGVGVDDCDLLL